MTDLGESHAKSGLDIGPELYELWLSALVNTVAENDPKFDAELDAAWREVANHGISVMLSMHDDD
ncbi:globin domain-containing protein [Methylogaea oryzae]|nr:globin domain-containing protein [Methylogaea oryzae]